jgi:hypothetical protein
MADEINLGKSKEQVAMELLYLIARGEGHSNLTGNGLPRDYALDLYYHCLRAAQGYEPPEKKK